MFIVPVLINLSLSTESPTVTSAILLKTTSIKTFALITLDPSGILTNNVVKGEENEKGAYIVDVLFVCTFVQEGIPPMLFNDELARPIGSFTSCPKEFAYKMSP